MGTADHHHHDDRDAFCLDCITADLVHEDVRGQIALLAALELKHLAAVRASIAGYAWRDEWARVLDVAALHADLGSDNAVRRLAARRAKEAVTDFLVYRMATANPGTVRLQLAPQLRDLERRTRARLDAIDRERLDASAFAAAA